MMWILSRRSQPARDTCVAMQARATSSQLRLGRSGPSRRANFVTALSIAPLIHSVCTTTPGVSVRPRVILASLHSAAWAGAWQLLMNEAHRCARCWPGRRSPRCCEALDRPPHRRRLGAWPPPGYAVAGEQAPLAAACAGLLGSPRSRALQRLGLIVSRRAGSGRPQRHLGLLKWATSQSVAPG